MSTITYPSGIEDKTNTPQLREGALDLKERVQGELKNLSADFIAQRDAALDLINSHRDAAKEATFSGPAHISGVTGSERALKLLADLFTPERGKGRSI